MNRLIRIVAFAVAVLVAGASPALGAPKPFVAHDLGSFRPATASSAWAINDKNQIVGTAVDGFDLSHGVAWRPDGTMRDLGVNVIPHDINNHGTIVGIADEYGSNPSAVVWRKGVMHPEIIDFAGLPFKVNDQEQMLLKKYVGPGYNWVYYFRDSDGQVTEFPPGYQLNDLNDWGQVIGTYNLGGGQPASHAFIWQLGVGTIRDFGPATEGQLINNKGHFVRADIVFSEGTPGDYKPRWYYYGGAGSTRKLIVEGWITVPLALNEKGQVAGKTAGFGGYSVAWFWAPNSGQIVFQAGSSFEDTSARDINESTQVVGESQFRIAPDPEVPGADSSVSRATRWTR